MVKEIENSIKKVVEKAQKRLNAERGEKFNSVFEFESMFRNNNAIAWGKHKIVDKSLKELQRDIQDLAQNKFMVLTDAHSLYDNLIWASEALINAAAITKRFIDNPVDAEEMQSDDLDIFNDDDDENKKDTDDE